MQSQSQERILPGFKMTLIMTLVYLGVIVVWPLAALFQKAAGLGFAEISQILLHPRVIASCKLSFGAALVAATINLFFGTIIAWVLVRVPFAGRKWMDRMIDLPTALPTAVAGIALTTIYAPRGLIGSYFAAIGMPAAFSRLGIVIALVFIGLPFVVRTLQPVLKDLERDMEEAAACLGAGRIQIFLRVVLPQIFPAMLTGFTLAFARGVGEYGSVVFISGNMPMKTEIAPLIIISKLEQYDYAGATAVAAALLAVSFILLMTIQILQKRLRQDHETHLAVEGTT